MRHSILWLLLLSIFLMPGHMLRAQEPHDTLPEDFVIASIVITDPGDVLYSRVGHAFLRMQCPEHGLDYCFSYESEDVKERVLSFLAGRLRMGMTAVPSEEYLNSYAAEGRGVYQYDLNLPIRVKQNLWRVLDNEKAKGMYLPYDYLQRGCAISVLHLLQEAVGSEGIDYGAWTDGLENMNRREVLARRLQGEPWTRLAVNILCNGSANDILPAPEKLVTPQDLVGQLIHAQAFGRVLLSDHPLQLVPHAGEAPSTCWLTPMVLAIMLLVVTLICAFLHWHAWDYVLLVLVTLLGVVNVYLVCFSSLCGTEWSWHIIPFNPLPLLLWRWRSRWALPYALVIVAWVLCMCFSQHSLTDPALLVLAVAQAVNYLSLARLEPVCKLLIKKK